MDAFAVSIIAGISQKDLKIKNAVIIALYFGFFQMMMPVFGWLAGTTLDKYIFPYQRIVAYLLLSAIGIKMISESKNQCSVKQRDYQCHYTLTLLAIATSIDALAAGISFSITGVSLFPAVIIIGVVTFVFSLSGVYLGKATGCLFHDYADLAGGIILIAIAFKILFIP